MKRILPLLSLCFILSQCAQKTASTTAGFRANPLADSIRIFTLQPDEAIPEKSEFVRDIQMGASLFSSNCGYKNLMNYAHFTAKQSGANVIHFTEIKRPVMGNGCYHINAKLYKNTDDAQLAKLANEQKVANQSRLPKDADYAIVHFYRPKSYDGAIISYNIKMDDQGSIGKSSNGHQFQYKVTSFGKHRFVGKTKKTDSVTLDIQKGQEYFIRCGVAKGPSISLPDMYVIENYVGIREMAEM
ncbi:hypothetical protein SAMN05216327_109159 [Dyadobacter sp. SG02]|uniref:hypothetical protein n=1 Tax=Dyadobacter sp. SG02 TaxID=1855291 RepID=UPI0008D2E865|nr:hypothetical protein [Dyadobacter sp. SG02]SEJ38394.1 hypothetical protein SAMN05216327_109159 [Dyadobacter sp. SG02]